MNQQTYRKITDGIRRLENGEKIVQFINSIATKIVYMALMRKIKDLQGLWL